MKKKFLLCLLFVFMITFAIGTLKAEELNIANNTNELFKRSNSFPIP